MADNDNPIKRSKRTNLDFYHSPTQMRFDTWNQLWQGALAVHNRFLVLEVLQRQDYGDDCFEWRIRQRKTA